MRVGQGRLIAADLYGIAARLKGIDSGYFVYFNYAAGRYELHYRRQTGDTLTAVLPYRHLDCRTETYVRRTRAERADKLLAEIEGENELCRRESLYLAQKKAGRGAQTTPVGRFSAAGPKEPL